MKFITTFSAILCSSLFSVHAQQAPLTFEEVKNQFPSAQQTGTANLGSQATITLQNGIIFLNGRDGDKLLQTWGNLPSQIEGLVLNTDGTWCITFEFSNDGYVKDDEKEDLDADEILKHKKEAQIQANEERKKQGLGGLEIVDWATKPNYNSESNNLEWALTLRNDTGATNINHEVRILGRHGVMNATLICGPEDQQRLIPVLRNVLANFQYTSGNKYSEYQKGDKIAEYGLTGLIVGGGAFVIWKFWKVILAGIVGVGVVIKKVFSKITGA